MSEYGIPKLGSYWLRQNCICGGWIFREYRGDWSTTLGPNGGHEHIEHQYPDESLVEIVDEYNGHRAFESFDVRHAARMGVSAE